VRSLALCGASNEFCEPVGMMASAQIVIPAEAGTQGVQKL
jgi:hypothetical protein